MIFLKQASESDIFIFASFFQPIVSVPLTISHQILLRKKSPFTQIFNYKTKSEVLLRLLA
jgi:hypothetical protein